MTYTRKLAIAGAALVSWLAIPGAAWAQVGYTGLPPDQVQGNQLARDPSVLGSEVSTETESSESSDTLPVTGGDLLGLTVIGLGAVGAGTLFVRRSRRTT